jgi:hypothetical protein
VEEPVWQDWVIAAVQAFFCVNLIPALRQGSGREMPLFTSVSTALGMAAIAAAVVTLGLYFAATTSAIVALEWAMLARQGRRGPVR